MRFWIVTPSFNQVEHLKKCVYSVADQTDFPDNKVQVHHHVQDGGSNDGTVKFLEEYSKNCARDGYSFSWASEKDNGMYDAINRGWKRAGEEVDILAYLNCDEQYLPNTLLTVKSYFNEHLDTDVIYGDALIVNPNGTLISFRKSYPLTEKRLYASRHLYALTCSIFYRKKIFNDGNYFSEKLKDDGDGEFILRLLRNKYVIKHIKRYFAIFTWTGYNMSLSENAKNEKIAVYGKMNLYKRIWLIPQNIVRLLYKLFYGCYTQLRSLTYYIYIDSNLNERTLFLSNKKSFFWPRGFMKKKQKKCIVVVGQTPPPFGGQSIMIEEIVKGVYCDIELKHFRMKFSKDMDEIGVLKLSKIIHLFVLIARVFFYSIIHKPDVLYYPPAGPDLIPMIRDLCFLIFIRPLFPKTVFHFHAAGISELYKRIPQLLKPIYRKAYFNADLGIRMSEFTIDDSVKLGCKNVLIIPYGIPEPIMVRYVRKQNKNVVILYVAVLKESKGIFNLLEACKLLDEKKLRWKLNVVGRFDSKATEMKINNYLKDEHLRSNIKLHGVLTGTKKNEQFLNADIFCLPTFFESESFPVVNLEAMAYSLPIVTTNWRGIPSQIKNGVNGYLVNPHSVEDLAKKLKLLILDGELRHKMGLRNREIYNTFYRREIYLENIEKAFISLFEN